MDEMGWSSKTGFQRTPPSLDFQTPPAAVAAYQVSGSPGTPQARATRPPAAGPTWRNLRYLNSGGPPLGSSSSAARAAAARPKTRRNANRRCAGAFMGARPAERCMSPKRQQGPPSLALRAGIRRELGAALLRQFLDV